MLVTGNKQKIILKKKLFVNNLGAFYLDASYDKWDHFHHYSRCGGTKQQK